MPRTPEETRALFDRWASTYDASLQGSRGSPDPLTGYRESLAEAASLLPVSPATRVLDVGIGTGAFAALLAERGAQIFGIDPSEKMLAACSERHPAFRLEVGDFLEIPFAAGTFDLVVSSFAFHEVLPEERPRACAELARVVKPGGTVCLLDIMFASEASREGARQVIGDRWDDEEDYPLVGALDATLHAAGLANTCWRQTAPWHWVVIARRPADLGRRASM